MSPVCRNVNFNLNYSIVIRDIYLEDTTMGDRSYKAGQARSTGMNALARDNSSVGVSAYSGAGDVNADARAIAANRAAQAGNEDPIAYANRIAREKKALAEKKAKEKAAAEAKAKAEAEAKAAAEAAVTE
jgi:colicin import membrane protein